MGILQILGSILLVIGWVFALTGSLGVLRMPDFYSRLHPAGMTDSFAQILIVLGLCMFSLQDLIPAEGAEPPDALASVGTVDTTIKLFLLVALIYLTSPTSTHAISKAARLDRFTKIQVEGDTDSRIADLVVEGDHHAPMVERPSEVFHVDEPDPHAPADKPSTDKGEA